jgi:MoxR-like ATPase
VSQFFKEVLDMPTPANRLVSANGQPSIIELSWHADGRTMLAVGQPPLVLLVGEPGSGKTTFAHHAAFQATGKSPIVLSGTPESEQSHLFGRWTLTGEETCFIDGPLPSALKEGRWLVIEEFSQIPIECRASLLPLRDQAEIANPLNGEVLPVPPEFRLIATSNSETLTCRKNSGIAKVLFDGFLVLEVPELDDIQVGRFLRHHHPKVSKRRVGRVLKLWNEYRGLNTKGSSGKSHLSYRAAAHLMALLERGMTESRAVQIALVNKFLATDSDLFEAAKLKNSISNDPEESNATNNPSVDHSGSADKANEAGDES